MAKNAKLLPCPFCGSAAKTDEMEPMPPEIDHVTHIVRCSHATSYHHKHGTGCPVMPEAYAETPELAAELWNTRAVPAEERVAKVVREIAGDADFGMRFPVQSAAMLFRILNNAERYLEEVTHA